jgi:hypothetical protein
MSTTHYILLGLIDGAGGVIPPIEDPPIAKKTGLALYLGLRLSIALFLGVLYHG